MENMLNNDHTIPAFEVASLSLILDGTMKAQRGMSFIVQDEVIKSSEVRKKEVEALALWLHPDAVTCSRVSGSSSADASEPGRSALLQWLEANEVKFTFKNQLQVGVFLVNFSVFIDIF